MSAVSQISLMVMLEIDLSCSSFKRLSFKTIRVYFFRRSIFEFKDQRSFPAFLSKTTDMSDVLSIEHSLCNCPLNIQHGVYYNDNVKM